MRFFSLEGLGYSKETAKGMEVARSKSEPRIRQAGPLRWTEDPPLGVPLPPPPLGYVTPEELTARIQQRNQDPDGPGWGSVEDFKNQAAASNLGDITPFLGPNRALVFFYGGRRRQGDVAHFCELSIARRTVEGFRLIVCVVDIVHGPNHDISRGAANFFWDQMKGERVAATGAAPHVKLLPSQD